MDITPQFVNAMELRSQAINAIIEDFKLFALWCDANDSQRELLIIEQVYLIAKRGQDMEKVIRDGKVAVLYSPGFGAGWFTWNTEHPGLLYDPAVVQWVEAGKPRGDELSELELYLEDKYHGMYIGSNMSDLGIAWLTIGTQFRITEYDGNEGIEIQKDVSWQVA